MSNIRLLHITATHLNLSGGVPVVLRDLVNAQNKIEGFESRVLSIKADISKMHSTYFDYLGSESFREYICSYHPDIVVFHSHYYFEYIRLSRILVKKGIPYLIEPHGSFGLAALKKSRYKKLVANGLLLRSYIKMAKGYVFLNESERSDSRYHSEIELVIPNGINEDELIEEWDTDKQWSFYFIGRFDVHHKGLDVLFDALDILEKRKESIRFNLFGIGATSEIEYINERIKNYSALQIENCGPIYGDEQKKRLEKHGIMVLTSRYEGFPMTVLEAWKYGNPCLVTAGTNVKDEVLARGLGWGAELDASNIADAIIKAKTEYSMMQEEYIRNCKNYVKDVYSWDRIAQISYDKISEVCKDGY